MIIDYHGVTPGRVVGPVDVCIIGSGAGGSCMAYYLSRAGFSVVVLEKGGYFPAEELGRKEVTTMTRIQSMTMFRPTSGEHTRVSLISGECYGGGTIAAEGASFEFPEVVKDDWERLGLKSFSRSNRKLYDYMDEINRLLSVKYIERHEHNPNNQLLAIAAEREGLEWTPSLVAVTQCMRCGNCTQGCRYGVKRDAAETFLKWSHEYDTSVFVGAKAETIKINHPEPEDPEYRQKLKDSKGAAREDILRRIEQRKKSAPARFTVEASVIDRGTPARRDNPPDSKGLTVHARRVVLSAGPIGDVRLLLKSRINPNRVVGKRFSTHPSTFALARMGRSVNVRGWDGRNCSTEVHTYANFNSDKPYYDPSRHGFLVQAAMSLPWGIANLAPGAGADHLALMRDYNRIAGIELLTKSDSYGEISEDRILFDISENDNQRLIFGTWLMARLLFRVGAEEVYTALPGLKLTSPARLDDIYDYRAGGRKGFMVRQANLHSGHIFGGCVMGTDPKESFAKETGECHEIRGLWVADGAAFPTNTGVNCLVSITLAARKIAQEFIDTEKPAGP